MLGKGQTTRMEYLIHEVVSAHTMEYPDFTLRLWIPNVAN